MMRGRSADDEDKVSRCGNVEIAEWHPLSGINSGTDGYCLFGEFYEPPVCFLLP